MPRKICSSVVKSKGGHHERGKSIEITLLSSDNSLTTACAAMSHSVLSSVGFNISSHVACTRFLFKLFEEAAFHGAEVDPRSSLKSKCLIELVGG